jgi:hypothetical protein
LDQLYGQVYQDNAALLMAFRRDGDQPPLALQVAAQVALTQQVRNGVRSLMRDWQQQRQLSPVGLSQLASLEATATTVEQLGCELTAMDLPKLVVELLTLMMEPMVQAWAAADESFDSAAHLEPLGRLLGLSQLQLKLRLDLAPLQERLHGVLRPLPVSCWAETMKSLARGFGLAVPQSFG